MPVGTPVFARHWDVLIQSGTTHGTMSGRLIDILGQLRPAKIPDDPLSQMGGQIARMSEFAVRRHGAYLNELGRSVDAPIDCP